VRPGAALLVIDMQRAIDAPYWAKDGSRNNPGAEAAGVCLLAAWRARGWPVIHVRHDSVEPQSSYRPGQEGNNYKPGFEPAEGEPVFPKQTGSAFTATGLDGHLRSQGVGSLCVFGVITNNSVETTVRHASTLGYEVHLVEDACFTFGRRDYREILHDAETVHAMSLANLDGEYCTVTKAEKVLQALSRA
jgi:nicotinamidase-related amidase